MAANTIFTALQPQLTDLRLISCLQLTYRAMANIVESLPALQRFAFSRSRMHSHQPEPEASSQLAY